MRSVRRLARDLTGRAEEDIVTGLIGQLDATLDGVTVALRAVRGALPADQAREEMTAIEHRGDQQRGELVTILSRSLTAPIDREDLFRLSRSIDDVLDNLRDLIREQDLFGLGADPLLEDVLGAVQEGVAGLRDAVMTLSADVHGTPRATLAAKKNEIRPRYQNAMADLLSQELSNDVLKRRELLRRLDVVGLRLGEAADALADGSVKRSH